MQGPMVYGGLKPGIPMMQQRPAVNPGMPAMQPRGFSQLPRIQGGMVGASPVADDARTPMPFHGPMGGGMVPAQPFASDVHTPMPFRGSVFGGVGGRPGFMPAQPFASDLTTPMPFRGGGMPQMGGPAMQPRPMRFIAPPVFRR